MGRGERSFHVDTLDLYSARARAAFVVAAAAEIEVDVEVVKGTISAGCCWRVSGWLIRPCRAAQTATDVVEPMTGPDRTAALQLLRDPGLVERISADFAAVGMVGEATNCLVGYLAAVSRKLAAAVGGDRAIDVRGRQDPR